MSYQTPRAPTRSARTNSSKNSAAKTKDAGKPSLDILPKEILERLTTDQAGLQKAAQSEAMIAPVGETIFWHMDGREGTAMTESESLMGGFTCRNFVQTIALEDYFDKATLSACRNANGAWIHSF